MINSCSLSESLAIVQTNWIVPFWLSKIATLEGFHIFGENSCFARCPAVRTWKELHRSRDVRSQTLLLYLFFNHQVGDYFLAIVQGSCIGSKLHFNRSLAQPTWLSLKTCSKNSQSERWVMEKLNAWKRTEYSMLRNREQTKNLKIWLSLDSFIVLTFT